MSKEYIPKYQTGSVLRRETNIGCQYWKILQIWKTGYNGETLSYYCVKCTSTGKEFKYTNGFCCNMVDMSARWSLHLSIDQAFDGKANYEAGNKITVKKRRVTYLEDRMKRDAAEL